MSAEENEKKLEAMKRKLAIMEWDLKRDQINPAQRMKYENLKKECVKLEEDLTSPTEKSPGQA